MSFNHRGLHRVTSPARRTAATAALPELGNKYEIVCLRAFLPSFLHFSSFSHESKTFSFLQKSFDLEFYRKLFCWSFIQILNLIFRSFIHFPDISIMGNDEVLRIFSKFTFTNLNKFVNSDGQWLLSFYKILTYSVLFKHVWIFFQSYLTRNINISK